MQARAGAALYSSPQQPCLVHGCPVRGHLDLDASSVGEVNHRIKLSAQWSDVAKVVTEMGERLHPSNIAYSLYRLGCMFCFLSSQRKAGAELTSLGQDLAPMCCGEGWLGMQMAGRACIFRTVCWSSCSLHSETPVMAMLGESCSGRKHF